MFNREPSPSRKSVHANITDDSIPCVPIKSLRMGDDYKMSQKAVLNSWELKAKTYMFILI